MTNQSMIQQSTSMQIFTSFFLLILFHQNSYAANNSSCQPCSSQLCYQCYNTFPIDRTNVEKLYLICNSSNNLFQPQERFYSIIQSYTTINCTMKILYLDQYTLWNYLEYMSITYAHLTRLSPVIFNRSLSLSPILYSIKTLNLSHNSIRILNKNFSYYFPSLKKLDLSYNHLMLIKKKTFKNLIHLKELYLNNNYLKQILPNIFPRQPLHFINLNMNSWHCSCVNVLTFLISRPVPICQSPTEFKNQNAYHIAQQCFLHTKANILVTTNISKERKLTCTISPIIDAWKNKMNRNITIISAWHIERRHPIPLEHLSALTNKSDKHLICFNSNSTDHKLISTIITLPLITSQPSSLNSTNQTKFIFINSTFLSSTTNTTLITLTQQPKLPPFFLWIFNTSKNILPKYFQKSNKHILIIWLILLIIAFLIFLFLIYFIHHHKFINSSKSSTTRSLIRLDTIPHDHRTLFNIKFNCKNHKCLCQYRRRAHSTMYLKKSLSSNLLEKKSLYIQPSLIEPSQLRYAKIKRISSTKTFDNDYLAGEFRTIVKLKSSPN